VPARAVRGADTASLPCDPDEVKEATC
jgi:hypothetical protein